MIHMNFIFGCHSSSSPSHDVSTTKNRHRMHGRNIKAMRSIGKNDKQVNATMYSMLLFGRTALEQREKEGLNAVFVLWGKKVPLIYLQK